MRAWQAESLPTMENTVAPEPASSVIGDDPIAPVGTGRFRERALDLDVAGRDDGLEVVMRDRRYALPS
jgi:hypothetical protein